MIGRLIACVVVLASAGTLARAEENAMDKDMKTEPQAFALTSPAFKNGEKIPKIHTGDGKDLSPALHWSGVPKGTKSFALIMDDPDAPPGTWVHWVLYDIPGGLKDLPEGLPKKETLSSGAKHGQCWGVSSFDRVGYYGPLPPPGTPHHYSFRLYALDRELGLKPRAAKDQALKAMEGHVLAHAELIGIYER